MVTNFQLFPPFRKISIAEHRIYVNPPYAVKITNSDIDFWKNHQPKGYIPFSKILTKEFREVISSRQKKHLAHRHKKLSVVADDKQKQSFCRQSFPQTQSAMLQFYAEIHAEVPQTAAFP